MAVVRWLSRSWRGLTAHIDLILLAGLAVVAVVPFGRLFVDHRFLVPVASLVALAFVVARVLARRSALTAWLAHIGVAVVFVVFAVFRVGVPTGSALRAVWDGSTGSWADLLTATLPAVPTARLVVLPVLVAWLAAVGSIELAQRRPWVSVPLVWSLGALTLALLFSGQRPQHELYVPAVFVLLALGTILLRANTVDAPGAGAVAAGGFGQDTHRRTMPSGQLRFGAPVVVVIGALGLAGAAVSPFNSQAHRYDLHERYQPPLDVSDAVSPLAQLRPGLNDDQNTAMFTVQFKDVPDGVAIDRVPLALLDTYDGVVFGTDASFARAGTELPPGPPLNRATAAIAQTYTLSAAYNEPFLPALSRPTKVVGSSIGFDRISGMLITDVSKRDGFSYEVVSDVPTTEPDLTAARPGNDAAVATLALPPPDGWPAAITEAATALEPGGEQDPAVLKRLEDDLKGKLFGYNTKAKPGHSLAVLSRMLTAPVGSDGAESGRVGYAEQFSAAFAVLARVKGFPSRVVVGYRVDPEAVKAGTAITVKASDIHAWTEVNVNGVGWVTFDPTNIVPRPPETPPATTVPPSSPTSISPSTIPDTTAGPGPGEGTPARPGPPLWPLAVVLVLLALPASVVLAKRVRRNRRRRNASTATMVIGAWSEARDRLRSHGVAVPRSSTPAELAEECEARVGAGVASGVRAFSTLVDHAIYAPQEPDASLADSAWRSEEDLAAALREGSSVMTRVRSAVDPRPLLGARRRDDR